VNNLNDMKAVQSDDPLKRDLELTCTKCATVLCDIEHDDTLDVLVRIAHAHDCPRKDAP
jgi:hypothetical protein